MHPRKIELLEEARARSIDIIEWYIATHAEIGEPVDGEVLVPGDAFAAINQVLDDLAVEILHTDDEHFEGKPKLKVVK